MDASEAERFKDGRNPIGRLWFDDLYLSKVGQDPEPLRGVLEPEMHRELGRLPAGEAGQLRGEQAFTEPRLLHLPGQDPIKVVGYSWTQDVVSGTRSFSVGIGVGGLVGELVFRTMDGSIHRIFTNRQIASWTFDGKDVVPR